MKVAKIMAEEGPLAVRCSLCSLSVLPERVLRVPGCVSALWKGVTGERGRKVKEFVMKQKTQSRQGTRNMRSSRSRMKLIVGEALQMYTALILFHYFSHRC